MENKTSKRLNQHKNTLNADSWVRLFGRVNEDKPFTDEKHVTALLDIRNQVIYISHDYCKEHGIQIHPISQIVNIEETGDIIDSLGYISAKLSLPIGNKMFKTSSLLLFFLQQSTTRGFL